MNQYDIENRFKKIEEFIMSCEVCKEKQSEINRILKAYKSEKKILYIVIACQMTMLIAITALGKDIVKIIMDAIITKFI